jgi:hypothetical protein
LEVVLVLYFEGKEDARGRGWSFKYLDAVAVRGVGRCGSSLFSPSAKEGRWDDQGSADIVIAT